MSIELTPLLKLQRELQAMPRGMARFQAYLRTITAGTDELVLPPLAAMNPMGKEHVSALLDELLEMDAETVAAAALAEAEARLSPFAGPRRFGLVVTDDAQGGWTNRYFSEMTIQFSGSGLARFDWMMAPLWTSEQWSPARVRCATLAAVYRAAWIAQVGAPTTLAGMLEQEGRVMRFAETPPPLLDPEELAYSREVIAPHLAASDYPTVMACLYGDLIAQSLGYPALGLSPYAGYSLAYQQGLGARGLGLGASELGGAEARGLRLEV